MYADIAFISAQGVDDNGNIFDGYLSEIPIRNIMLKNSRCRVFLADKSKIGRLSVYLQCDFNDVDRVVSEVDLEEIYGERYKNTEFVKV